MPKAQAIAIYGAGGHAREVAWLLNAFPPGTYDLRCFIEDGAPAGRVLNGTPVLSWEAFTAAGEDAKLAIAVGDPRARRALVQKCEAAGHGFATLIHPDVGRPVFIEYGEGAVVFGGSTLTTNIQLARHVHVNAGCTIAHDARIGEFATLAPGVHVAGHVHIGRDAWVGVGATIINGTAAQPLVIGDGCVIAAGACVTRSTEAAGLYAGVPAELKKRY
jgi:sugar O-acyltransferase (sialic acid O-acetyltransferase NeuD family)